MQIGFVFSEGTEAGMYRNVAGATWLEGPLQLLFKVMRCSALSTTQVPTGYFCRIPVQSSALQDRSMPGSIWETLQI